MPEIIKPNSFHPAKLHFAVPGIFHHKEFNDCFFFLYG